MTPIVVNDFLDVPLLQETDSDFKSVSDEDRAKIAPDMEVMVRRGENVRIRIDSIDGNTLIGFVLTESEWEQPFNQYDWVQFEKKNVFDIYDLGRWGGPLY